MNHTYHIRAGLFVCVAAYISASLSACSPFTREANDHSGELQAYTEDSLESGNFYIYHDKKYYRLPYGEPSYNSTQTQTEASDERTMWFGEDIVTIPTMYPDDKLMYYSEEEFEDTFTFERYEDMGPTIGICHLEKQEQTGRYKFSLKDTDYDVDAKSSAYDLYNIGDTTATLDSIGETPLRDGNISRAGTVEGLEEGKTYALSVYVGTSVYEINVTADVRAFTSMEVFSTSNYNYTKSKTISIAFPTELNSGYYCVNDIGMFRYVNGDSYDDVTDFDMPNDYSSINMNDAKYESSINENENTFTIDSTVDARIEFRYETDDEDRSAPVVRLVAEDAVYTLHESSEEGLLYLETTLKPGTYRLSVSGIDGRKYVYQVKRTKD